MQCIGNYGRKPRENTDNTFDLCSTHANGRNEWSRNDFFRKLTKSKYAKWTHYLFRETNKRTYFWLTRSVLCWLQMTAARAQIVSASVDAKYLLCRALCVRPKFYWLWVTLQVFTDSGTPARHSGTVCCSRNPKSNIWKRFKWVEALGTLHIQWYANHSKIGQWMRS